MNDMSHMNRRLSYNDTTFEQMKNATTMISSMNARARYLASW